MGLEQVKQGLEDELEQKRQSILDEAEERKRSILSDAEDELQAYRENAEETTQERVESLKRKRVSTAKLEARKRVLAAKKEAVDQVMQDAATELAENDSDVVEALLDQAKEEIDIGKVVCAPRNEDDITGYETETREDMLGGVICYDPSGDYSLDLSYQTLLDDIREEHIQDIAEELFA